MIEITVVLLFFLGIQLFVTCSIAYYKCSPIHEPQNMYFQWMVSLIVLKTIFLFTIGIVTYFYDVHECRPINSMQESLLLVLDLFLCVDMMSVVTSPL